MNAGVTQVKNEDSVRMSDAEEDTRSVSIKVEPVIIKMEPELVQVYSAVEIQHGNPWEDRTEALFYSFNLTKQSDTEEKRMALLLHLHNSTRIRPDTVLEQGGGFLNMKFDHLFMAVLFQLSLHDNDLAQEAMLQDAETDLEDEETLAEPYNSDMETDDEING